MVTDYDSLENSGFLKSEGMTIIPRLLVLFCLSSLFIRFRSKTLFEPPEHESMIQKQHTDCLRENQFLISFYTGGELCQLSLPVIFDESLSRSSRSPGGVIPIRS